MNASHKEDQRTIEGFLARREDECQTIGKWVSRVVKLNSWGLNEYVDDITQDILLKLYNNLRESKFQFAASLKTYVYRIAKFTCIEYLRKHSSKKRKEIQLHDFGFNRTEAQGNGNPEQEMEKFQERKLFWRIYRLMSSECRELWKMVFWENLSYKQIAQKMSIKEGTVKSRFARCKEKAIGLRKKLTEKELLF